MKKYSILAVIVCLFALPAYAHANMIITEIMYDPPGTDTNNEWVEVYNGGTDSVDLSKYYFHDAGPSGTAHGIKQVGSIPTSVAPGAYAIIASGGDTFAAANPGLTVLDSSFDISDSASSTLVIAEDSGKPPVTIDDQAVCDPTIGGNNDGNSLQKTDSGTWIAALPTPGAANATQDDGGTTAGGSTGGTGGGIGTTNTATATAVPPPLPATPPPAPKITAHIIGKKTIISGIASHFQPAVTGYSGEMLSYGEFSWNFGDGMSRNDTKLADFDYTYEYPGDYIVNLDYYSNPYDTITPDATDRLLVKVVAPETIISSVTPDGGIEIADNSSYEMDLPNWVLATSTGKSFTIPKSTFIISGKKVILGPKITQFTLADTSGNITLSNPSGSLISAYPETNATAGVSDPAVQIVPPAIKSSGAKINDTFPPAGKINTASIPLAGSAILADEKSSDAGSNSDPMQPQSGRNYMLFFFAGLIIIGAGGVLYVRRARSVSLEARDESGAGDIEILEDN